MHWFDSHGDGVSGAPRILVCVTFPDPQPLMEYDRRVIWADDPIDAFLEADGYRDTTRLAFLCSQRVTECLARIWEVATQPANPLQRT